MLHHRAAKARGIGCGPPVGGFLGGQVLHELGGGHHLCGREGALSGAVRALGGEHLEHISVELDGPRAEGGSDEGRTRATNETRGHGGREQAGAPTACPPGSRRSGASCGKTQHGTTAKGRPWAKAASTMASVACGGRADDEDDEQDKEEENDEEDEKHKQ